MKPIDAWMAEALAVLTRREQLLLWMRFGVGPPPSGPVPNMPDTLARQLEARALRKLRVSALRPAMHTNRDRFAVVAPLTFGERPRRTG
jgi:DNA-directed RNA polymerase sigma subunit (sigma70/sigma32)